MVLNNVGTSIDPWGPHSWQAAHLSKTHSLPPSGCDPLANFLPISQTTTQSVPHQFGQEKAVGNGVERFAQVQVSNIHRSPHVHRRRYVVVESDQVSLPWFIFWDTFHQCVWILLLSLAAIYMYWNGTLYSSLICRGLRNLILNVVVFFFTWLLEVNFLTREHRQWRWVSLTPEGISCCNLIAELLYFWGNKFFFQSFFLNYQWYWVETGDRILLITA